MVRFSFFVEMAVEFRWSPRIRFDGGLGILFPPMVLPNFAFDALMFGLLLLAAGLDSAFPVTHGALSLLVVGGATYWAAQELSDALLRRAGWTQESLATSVALCWADFCIMRCEIVPICRFYRFRLG